jgi:hypothetical protein
MRHAGVPMWVRADEVKRTAKLTGLDRLQQYLDHLTATRAYGWYESRTPTADELRQPAANADEENLGHYEQPTTELVYRKVEPLRGSSIDEYLSTKNLVTLVRAMPFVRWYSEERQRLQHDVHLLAIQAKQWKRIAEAAQKRAQAAYKAAESYTSDEELSDWQKAQLRRARHNANAALYSHAAVARRNAIAYSIKAARTRSDADRLGKVKSRDLILLGAALESFICREFTHVLASIDSVAMLFVAWIDAESISCANPKCSQHFLHTSARRRRPQEYCSPACKMVAYRAREDRPKSSSSSPPALV